MKLSLVCLLMLSLHGPLAFAEESTTVLEINEHRALFNYQMLCQGCHVGDGSGGKDVPNMKGAVGQFLKTQEGREYLIRVPGTANSALDNRELAELMNWMLPAIGKESVPEDFIPFSEKEIGALRQDPLMEVVEHRAQLLIQISALKSQ